MSYQPPEPGFQDTQILEPPHMPDARPDRARKAVGAVAVLLVVALAAGVAGFAYLQLRLGDVERVDVAGLGSSSSGMTILLVGSDSREGLAPGQESFGTAQNVSGQRSDAIMLLRAQPGGSASVLSIPRDLWVPIAGTGGSGRINGAYAGGPDRLTQTVTQALGIPIDHYVEVNFDGFRSVVDAIGGLNLYFAAPARDGLAELDVPAAGCILLSGSRGLAYVRSRHYESLEDGRWRSDPTGDIGRIERQQDFIRRMLRKALSRGVRNPLVANELLGAMVDNVTFDRGLGAFDLARLGWRLRSVASGGVEMMTLPTVGARISGAAVLQAQEPEAGQAINRFLNPAPPGPESVEPSEVRVRVLNGSGREGEAGAAADRLARAGFAVAGATDSGTRPGTTLIRYADGARAKAELVAGMVGEPHELQAEAGLTDVDVELVTGATFGGIVVPGEPEPPPAPVPPAEDPLPAAPECRP